MPHINVDASKALYNRFYGLYSVITVKASNALYGLVGAYTAKVMFLHERSGLQ